MNLAELLTQNTFLLALSTAQMADSSTLPRGGLSFPVCRVDLRGECERGGLATHPLWAAERRTALRKPCSHRGLCDLETATPTPACVGSTNLRQHSPMRSAGPE